MIDSKWLKIAIENPPRFYSNFLVDELEDDSDAYIPYCCVLYFLCQQYPGQSELIDKFKKSHSQGLNEESNKIKAEIKTAKSEQYKNLISCRQIRDVIFNKEKKELLNCRIESDYIRYLELYGDLCDEFSLFAKFQLAQLTNETFNDLPRVIINYPNSDLFNIEEIKSKCDQCNGIWVCWSNDITDLQKECIIEIISSVTQMASEVSKSTPIDKAITKRQKLIIDGLYDDRLKAIVPDFDAPFLMTYDEAKRIIIELKQLTGLQWEFPIMNSGISDGSNNESIQLWDSTHENLDIHINNIYKFLLPTITLNS